MRVCSQSLTHPVCNERTWSCFSLEITKNTHGHLTWWIEPCPNILKFLFLVFMSLPQSPFTLNSLLPVAFQDCWVI